MALDPEAYHQDHDRNSDHKIRVSFFYDNTVLNKIIKEVKNMRPDQRYCRRVYHESMDPRILYELWLDENAELSDDIENFKYDERIPEDVELFNRAFCDRIAKIWQDKEEYFGNNAIAIDWFDAYSNLVYQLNTIERHKEQLKTVLNGDYTEFESFMQKIKDQYSYFTDFMKNNTEPHNELKEFTKDYDAISDWLQLMGKQYGFRF